MVAVPGSDPPKVEKVGVRDEVWVRQSCTESSATPACPLPGGVFHGHLSLPHPAHAVSARSDPSRGLEGHPVLSHPPVPPPIVFQGERGA